MRESFAHSACIHALSAASIEQLAERLTMAAECGAQLMALGGEQGTVPVVKAWGATLLAADDVGVVTDVDTLNDQQRAAGILAARKA